MNVRPTSTADEVDLIAEFEQGRSPQGFHHGDHVRVAFAYLAQFPFLEGAQRFCAALKRFAATQGKPQLYHETITWAFLCLIRERRARSGASTWAEFVQRNADLLAGKSFLLERFYRKETLDSDLARAIFVFPDQVTPNNS